MTAVWLLAAVLIAMAFAAGALLLGYGVWRGAEMLVKELVTYHGPDEEQKPDEQG